MLKWIGSVGSFFEMNSFNCWIKFIYLILYYKLKNFLESIALIHHSNWQITSIHEFECPNLISPWKIVGEIVAGKIEWWTPITISINPADTAVFLFFPVLWKKHVLIYKKNRIILLTLLMNSAEIHEKISWIYSFLAKNSVPEEIPF